MSWKAAVLALAIGAGSFSWQAQRGLIELDGGQALAATAAPKKLAQSPLNPAAFIASPIGQGPSYGGFSPTGGAGSNAPETGFARPDGAPNGKSGGPAKGDASPTQPDRTGSRIIETPTAPESVTGPGQGTLGLPTNQFASPTPSGTEQSGGTGGASGLGGGGSPGFAFVPQPPGGGFLLPAAEIQPTVPQTDPTTPAISAIPEPSTWALFILGFFAIGHGMRRMHLSSPRKTSAAR